MAVVLAEFEYGKYLIAPWYTSMVNHTRQSGDITMVQMVWIVNSKNRGFYNNDVIHITCTCANDRGAASSQCIKGLERFSVNDKAPGKL